MGRPSPKKGRPLTPEQRVIHQAVRAIQPFADQHGNVYYTIKEASEKTGASRGNICNVLKGKRKSAAGLIFRHLDSDVPPVSS